MIVKTQHYIRLLPEEIPDREPEETSGDKSGETSLPAFGAPHPPKQAKLKHFAVDKRTQLTVRYANSKSPFFWFLVLLTPFS